MAARPSILPTYEVSPNVIEVHEVFVRKRVMVSITDWRKRHREQPEGVATWIFEMRAGREIVTLTLPDFEYDAALEEVVRKAAEEGYHTVRLVSRVRRRKKDSAPAGS